MMIDGIHHNLFLHLRAIVYLFVETAGSERFLRNPRYRNPNFWVNKNREFVAFRYEFPILAGALGLEPRAYGFGDRRSTN